MNIGFAMCGSFCTFSKVFPIMEQLSGEHKVFPILSTVSYTTDSRFGKAESFITLAERLCKSGISVSLIEHNYDRCVQLASLLPDASVVHGDATDQQLLQSQGLSDCDALVTMTGLDELNMIISLYGSSKGVPQVITKLSRAENRSISDDLALGSVICPKELCCDDIVRYVRAMENQVGSAISVHSIAGGQAEAIEFLVDDHTLHQGTPLKEIKLRNGVLLASITRGGLTEIANGDSVFHKGNTILVVTSGRGKLGQLNDIFA
jgi:trk system potassium uptake protein TrkA